MATAFELQDMVTLLQRGCQITFYSEPFGALSDANKVQGKWNTPSNLIWTLESIRMSVTMTVANIMALKGSHAAVHLFQRKFDEDLK